MCSVSAWWGGGRAWQCQCVVGGGAWQCQCVVGGGGRAWQCQCVVGGGSMAVEHGSVSAVSVRGGGGG